MSSFIYYKKNKPRYNIYKGHIETIEEIDFYITLRNILFSIALILSLLILGLISLDTYTKEVSKTLIINQQQNQGKDEMTKFKLKKVISNSIFQKVDEDKRLASIDSQQLKLIIKNVMEKIENSPNQIIYTQQ